MSDGNYNRNLLPYRNYQSGVRAGQATMRQRALDAFNKFLEKAFPDKDKREKETLLAEFRQELLQGK